mgnify:CR=1 FL=1
MGQRLVVQVQHLGENIACIYYHWSAYTVSALWEARKIWNCICDEDDGSVHDLLLRLIRMVEKDGGGIDGGGNSEEFKKIQSMFPNASFKTENINRSDGLIALSEKGMGEMLGWAAGTITIDIDEETIENNVFWECTLEEYQEEHELKNVSIDDFPELDTDLSFFCVCELNGVIETLENLSGFCARHGETIYEIIS